MPQLNQCLPPSDQVRKEVGDVTILVNNADLVTGKPFLDIPDHMVEKSFLVNAISHFWVNLFLYHFILLVSTKIPCSPINTCSCISL